VVANLTLGLGSPTVAGDDIFIAADHVEPVSGAAITYTSLGTAAVPCRIFVADHTAALVGGSPPPSALLHTPTVTLPSGVGFNMTLAGVVSHCEGITFNVGAAGATVCHFVSSGQWALKNCHVYLNNTAGASTIRPTGLPATRTVWDSVSVQFGIAAQSITPQGGELLWKNTPTVLLGSITPSAGFFGAGSSGMVTLRGVDLTTITGARTLIAGAISGSSFYLSLFGCREPSGWTSVSRGGTPTADVSMVIADRSENGALNYTKYKEDYFGSQTTETTIVRTGGNTDGTTPTSWKIDTSTRAKARPQRPFRSTPMVIWNDVTAANRTVTVYGIASALPNNNDIWLEIEYHGSSTSPILTIDTQTTIATPLTTAVPVATDSSTWGGALTGKFKLVATLSAPQPAMKGPMTIRVCVGGQGIYYIDWQPVIS
jgi:hypothetical protein